ncbi:hypothetical protein SCALM49S_08087 [Streptomyces californicus]
MPFPVGHPAPCLGCGEGEKRSIRKTATRRSSGGARHARRAERIRRAERTSHVGRTSAGRTALRQAGLLVRATTGRPAPRRRHTAAGFLTVAAAVVGAAARYDRGEGGPVAAFLGTAVEGGIAGCALITVAVVCRRGRSERTRDTRLDGALITYLPGSALALLALAVVHAAWSRPDWQSAGTLPGEAAFRLLSLGQGILVVALAVVARGLYLRAPDPRTVLRGLGGPVVAMLACALGGYITGGAATDADQPGPTWHGYYTDIPGPPVVLSWQASVIPVLLILLLVPVVFLVVRTARRARRLGPVIEAEYAPEQPDEGRTRRIARIRATAALTDSAPWIVGVVSAATLLLERGRWPEPGSATRYRAGRRTGGGRSSNRSPTRPSRPAPG